METIKTTKVFTQLANSEKRISVFQGGTRSGKTYNIIVWLVVMALSTKNRVYTICRATLTSLKGSVLRDFIEILNKLELYDERNHNRTENNYVLNENLFEFISIDQPIKIRGRKRHFLFINEANELDYESWMQLLFRTSDKIILDYNPSDEFHWIYEKVITRDDADFYQSTYLDNPFLDEGIRNEIERLREGDENYWKVYGLGERASLEGLVFKNWTEIDVMPNNIDMTYGLDFGFVNDASALIAVGVKGKDLFVDEIFYKHNLTNEDIGNVMRLRGISRTDEIIADSSEPKSIHEIWKLGFNIFPARKGKDSVKYGINLLLNYKIYVTCRSRNVVSELRNYRWKKDKEGNWMNVPIDKYNHCIDAIRYVAQMKLGGKRSRMIKV